MKRNQFKARKVLFLRIFRKEVSDLIQDNYHKTVNRILYNLCIVFLYDMVLNYAILIFALFFFREY